MGSRLWNPKLIAWNLDRAQGPVPGSEIRDRSPEHESYV